MRPNPRWIQTTLMMPMALMARHGGGQEAHGRAGGPLEREVQRTVVAEVDREDDADDDVPQEIRDVEDGAVDLPAPEALAQERGDEHGDDRAHRDVADQDRVFRIDVQNAWSSNMAR